MPIRVTCRNKMKLDEKIRALVLKKVERIKRHFRKVDSIEVIFKEEEPRFSCEILVHAGSFSGAAISEAEDAGKAFDLSLKRVDAQVRRQKERRGETAKQGKPTIRRTAAEPAIEDEE